jgi:hypothetical protein
MNREIMEKTLRKLEIQLKENNYIFTVPELLPEDIQNCIDAIEKVLKEK